MLLLDPGGMYSRSRARRVICAGGVYGARASARALGRESTGAGVASSPMADVAGRTGVAGAGDWS